jgi:hypothetical protein
MNGIQHADGSSKQRRVLLLRFHQPTVARTDRCGVWASSPVGARVRDPLKSWPRLPKILCPSVAPSCAQHCDLHETTAIMARTKEKQPVNGSKRHLLNDDPFELKDSAVRPSKKAKLLDDSDASDAEQGATLKVNDAYARRFEFNKKREETHRCM